MQSQTPARHRGRTAPRRGDDEGDLAGGGRSGLRGLDTRAAAVIRVDAVWLAVEPLDMRAGTEAALARVVTVFGAAGRTTPTCSPTGAPTA
jgi:hypothetical protein